MGTVNGGDAGNALGGAIDGGAGTNNIASSQFLANQAVGGRGGEGPQGGRGGITGVKNPTVGDWTKTWIEIVERTRRPSTAKTYRTHIKYLDPLAGLRWQ